MAGLNKVMLIGNLGKDPEVKTMNNGDKVANFSLATGESWKDKNTGERKEKVEWHNIVIFNQGLISVVEKFVKKGSKIYLEGQLQTRKWQKDGQDRFTTEIVLQKFRGEVTLLDSRNSGGGRDEGGNDGGDGGRSEGRSENRRPANNSGGGSSTCTDFHDDDIPF
jgi:single-strand DNA-binding protein